MRETFSGPAQPVAICADDYGLSPGVCDSIEALITAGRLSATSCMCGLPEWALRAPGLRRVVAAHGADVGLHLTLTDQPALTRAAGLATAGRLPPLRRLLPRALLHALPAAALGDEIRAQFDAFEDAWGAPPDHVDGHQHVHLLPGVRSVLLAEIERRYGFGRLWLRDCREPLARCRARGIAPAKAAFVSWLGGPLGRRLDSRGAHHNDGFSGLHDFDPGADFGALMRAFLAHRGARHLVMVHPGHVDAVLLSRDTLTGARVREHDYLASPRFAEDLDAAGARPARIATAQG